MGAIAKMVRTLLTITAVGILLAVIVLPIALAVHFHASLPLVIDIVTGEMIVLCFIGFFVLMMFVKGMSR